MNVDEVPATPDDLVEWVLGALAPGTSLDARTPWDLVPAPARLLAIAAVEHAVGGELPDALLDQLADLADLHTVAMIRQGQRGDGSGRGDGG